MEAHPAFVLVGLVAGLASGLFGLGGGVVVVPALSVLGVGGRIVVLSYQSLEDRLVKRVFAEASASTAPRGLPVELPEHKAELKLLVRGSEQASQEEQDLNPRAKPVRLRAIERMRVTS